MGVICERKEYLLFAAMKSNFNEFENVIAIFRRNSRERQTSFPATSKGAFAIDVYWSRLESIHRRSEPDYDDEAPFPWKFIR